jgi:hypothetical protein
VLEFNTLFGQMVCAFGIGVGMRTGNLDDAFNLCLFIQANDL